MTGGERFPGATGPALVTGAAQGIGAAIARAFAAAGRDVALLDLHEEQAAVLAAELTREHAIRAIGVGGDVTDTASVDAALDRVEAALGAPSALVNNAGFLTPRFRPVESMPLPDFEAMLAVHLRGAFLLSARTMPGLKAAGGGAIVNVSSLVGLAGFAHRIGYAAAKAGVLGLTRSLAVEGGPSGVTVNAIVPGWILTPLVETRIAEGTLDERSLLGRTPLARWGRTEDVSSVVVALCSPAFSFVTGAVIPVDGGYLAHGDDNAAMLAAEGSAA